MPGAPPRGIPVGGALLALGTAPFIAGVASNAAGLGAEGAPRLICPFATATGLPCPFCGASRAFRLVASGDPAFVQYNPFWVVIAALMVAVGLALLVAQRLRGRPAAYQGQGPPRWATGYASPLGVLGVLMLGGWCVALSNRDAILS